MRKENSWRTELREDLEVLGEQVVGRVESVFAKQIASIDNGRRLNGDAQSGMVLRDVGVNTCEEGIGCHTCEVSIQTEHETVQPEVEKLEPVLRHQSVQTEVQTEMEIVQREVERSEPVLRDQSVQTEDKILEMSDTKKLSSCPDKALDEVQCTTSSQNQLNTYDGGDRAAGGGCGLDESETAGEVQENSSTELKEEAVGTRRRSERLKRSAMYVDGPFDSTSSSESSSCTSSTSSGESYGFEGSCESDSIEEESFNTSTPKRSADNPLICGVAKRQRVAESPILKSILQGEEGCNSLSANKWGVGIEMKNNGNGKGVNRAQSSGPTETIDQNRSQSAYVVAGSGAVLQGVVPAVGNVAVLQNVSGMLAQNLPANIANTNISAIVETDRSAFTGQHVLGSNVEKNGQATDVRRSQPAVVQCEIAGSPNTAPSGSEVSELYSQVGGQVGAIYANGVQGNVNEMSRMAASAAVKQSSRVAPVADDRNVLMPANSSYHYGIIPGMNGPQCITVNGGINSLSTGGKVMDGISASQKQDTNAGAGTNRNARSMEAAANNAVQGTINMQSSGNSSGATFLANRDVSGTGQNSSVSSETLEEKKLRILNGRFACVGRLRVFASVNVFLLKKDVHLFLCGTCGKKILLCRFCYGYFQRRRVEDKMGKHESVRHS